MKAKCILLGLKLQLKNAGKLNKIYNRIEIMQYSKVTYMGCLLGKKMSRKSMALKTSKKVNQKLKFLYRRNRYLTLALLCLLCNAIIQPHFHYACSAWHTNLTQKLTFAFIWTKCLQYLIKNFMI